MKQTGFTIVELLIVIVLVGILSSLVFVGIGKSQMRGRDTERAADIDVIHAQLEEYYTDKGAYPDTINRTLLPSLPPEVLVDPLGGSIQIYSPVASQAAAQATANPTGTPNYAYIPYPTGCGATNCRGYILKSLIENPTLPMTNPYVRAGLHNN